MKLEFNFSQSAVIPYRRINNSIDILLITSIKKKRWIVPKGYVEFNLSPFESAKKEAYEEAGVLGTNETVELGEFIIDKPVGVTRVKVYTMEVIEDLNEYPEVNIRKRKWFPVKEAISTISIPEISKMLATMENKFYHKN